MYVSESVTLSIIICVCIPLSHFVGFKRETLVTKREDFGDHKGKTLVTEGKTLVTKGKTLVTEGKTLVTKGKTSVTKEKTLVTKGKTLVIKEKTSKTPRPPYASDSKTMRLGKAQPAARRA